MMIHHPDIQKKVQQELDTVANRRKFVTMADKVNTHKFDYSNLVDSSSWPYFQDNLPYTEAVLNESWRINHIAPSGPPRLGNIILPNV